MSKEIQEVAPAWMIDTKFSVSIGTLCPATNNKILIFGESQGEDADYTIGRLLSNGELDESFNNKGYFEYNFNHSETSQFLAVSAFQQSDAKIFLTGVIIEVDSGELFPAAARFLESGELDSTFWETGMHIFSAFPDSAKARGATPKKIGRFAGSKANRAAHSSAQSSAQSSTTLSLPDGGYLIASEATGYLLRLDDNGKLVSDFGDKGYLLPKLHDQRNLNLLNALFYDNKIFVVGYVGNQSAVACFKLSGELDSQFGTNGSLLFEVSGASNSALWGITSTANSTYTIVGLTNTSPSQKSKALLSRITANGTFDPAFAEGTPIQFSPPERQASFIHVACAQIDEAGASVYSAGISVPDGGGNARLLIAAFQADGTPDKSFSPTGWTMGPEVSTALGMYLNTSLGLLVSGYTRTQGEGNKGMVALYKLNNT